MPDNVFITYSHPKEFAEPANRQRVARHVATHHRNRSAPAIRNSVASHPRQNRRLAPASIDKDHTITRPRDEPVQSLPPSAFPVPRDHSGFRSDPFAVLPTSANEDAMVAVDYCKDVYPKCAPHSCVQTFNRMLLIISSGQNLLPLEQESNSSPSTFGMLFKGQ